MPWKVVMPVADVTENEVASVPVDGLDLAIYLVDGTYYAPSNICTHAYARLSDGYFEGCIVECPLHQAAFDVTNGAVVTGPARDPLAVFPTRARNGWIELDLP